MGDVDRTGSPSAAYRLPMFPLSTVLFPSGGLPLHIFEPRYRQMTADCLAGNGELGVVLITRGSEVGGGDERVAVGTAGHLDGATRLPDGRWLLSVGGRRRVRVIEWLPERPYPMAMVEDLDGSDGRATTGPDERHGGPGQPSASLLEAALVAVRRARALLSELGRGAQIPPELEARIHGTSKTDAAAWLVCDAAPLGDLDRQRLLEASGPGERLDLVRRLANELADDLVRMLGSSP